MPQMMPMLWMFIYIYVITLLISVVTIIYFSPVKYKFKHKGPISFINFSNKWTWKW